MKILGFLLKTTILLFVVFSVYIGSLFFFEQTIPVSWVHRFLDSRLPADVVVRIDSASFGFRRGVRVGGLRVCEAGRPTPILSAAKLEFSAFAHRLRIEELSYPRLPEGYYAPGNTERNARVECTFPDVPPLHVTLIRPDVLAVRPARLDLEVEVSPRRVEFRQMHLVWPDPGRELCVDGFCYVDIDRQEVYGDVRGLARQDHVRPLIVALDVPVALPYMDGFTEVPEPCPASCAWKVNLVNSDFDLWLGLHPVLGRYNGVEMQRADGTIHLHNYTRGTWLNYVTTVGPITAVDPAGRTLGGTVVVTGTNGYNTVDVKADSLLPLADILKIGGFVGDYVGTNVLGTTKGELRFSFPRAMSNNYEVLNAKGHVTVKDGQLMRMQGFRGLIDAMPSVAPAVTWFSDSTQASCDYVIENGVLKTKNALVEGSMFSISFAGQLDTVRQEMDFTVRVQFAKNDSFMGKVLHPLTWPFTKLLLEFRLTGSPENPKWRYVSVVDRVLEAVK